MTRLDNPADYSALKKQIMSDFQAANPKVKIKTHKSWKGITEFRTGGRCDLFIPPGGGPTAVKVLLHEICHVKHGAIEPVCLGEFFADRDALRLMKRYGVEITENILKRIYKYQVECARKHYNKNKGKLPYELHGFIEDVKIWNDNGEKWWRDNVRDHRLTYVLEALGV